MIILKVSVIVPVYNSEKDLRTCLESLVNQTLSEIEIIVIDDCSKDQSLEILREYERKYPTKIKVLQNEKNLGQSATRNKGIQVSQGEYIGFVDSDDYVNTNMYQTMYEEACRNQYPEVITTGLIFVRDDYYLETNFDGLKRRKGRIMDVLKTPDEILEESPSACNKLFRKDTIRTHLFLEGRMWEDVAFSFAKMFCANQILSFSHADYFYRRRTEDGVSAAGYDVNPHLLDIFAVADKIELEVRERGRFQELEKQVRFVQYSACLQRVVEILNWKISEVDKMELCYLMSSLIIQKYGDFRKISIEELSSRVGFLELEKINDILRREDNLEQISLQEKLEYQLNNIKRL